MCYAQVFVGSMASYLTYSKVETTKAEKNRQRAARELSQN